MYRNAIKKLIEWKASPYRKPLILEGARQVGKTWLMKEFAKQAYTDSVYINFDNEPLARQIFEPDLDTKRILRELSLLKGKQILPNMLVIFDEIQEMPKALLSLKYFYENAPEYHIICAGSLLGIALHQGTNFPVGKVEFLKLYPLSFAEFLDAWHRKQYAELLYSGDADTINRFSNIFEEALRYYYYIGGMPEAVMRFIETEDFEQVRSVHENILSAYTNDYSKHAPRDQIPRIDLVWNSIPSQLARENKKFLFGLVREGGRARDFEIALMWLHDCGLIHQIYRTTKPAVPLKAYTDLKGFKIYMLDVGLLGCMADLDPKVIIKGNHILSEFKGAMTEQFVCQELKANCSNTICYYTNERNSSEIDFLIDNGDSIIPVEVKAETNLQAKSLQSYIQKYEPQIAIRTSMCHLKNEPKLMNLPLYTIGAWKSWLPI